MSTKRARDVEENTEGERKCARMSRESLYENLIETARTIASPGKGILAADESTGTIKKRFDTINLNNTEETRRGYRELLLTTPGLEKYISGCILYEETLYQKTQDGKLFTDVLMERGIVPGIKVDLGLKPLPGTDGELFCQGLTDLDVRCKKYYEAGARFAKWRAAYQIDLKKGKPSQLLVETQAHDLARYAAICQANGLVPIVEPELLMDGDHDIETCAHVSEHVWATVVNSLQENNVFLEGCLLKPNMVMAGQDFKEKVTPETVATYTLRTLQRTIPPAIPGILFLSGGQSVYDATLNLDAINKQANRHPDNVPWKLSFSYGRALQASTLKAWGGKPENLEIARITLLKTCKANSEAQLGKFEGKSENYESEDNFDPGYDY